MWLLFVINWGYGYELVIWFVYWFVVFVFEGLNCVFFMLSGLELNELVIKLVC